MLRRAASGHIAATQSLKFAAASRIALAVIRGWPEAPSSPLQGGAAPGAVCGCAGVPDCGPVKMLPRKFEIPSPEDWAWASTASKTVAASMAAPARLTIDDPVSLIVPYPSLQNCRVSKGLVTVSNGLTRGKARELSLHIGLCSRLQTGYQRAIECLFPPSQAL